MTLLCLHGCKQERALLAFDALRGVVRANAVAHNWSRALQLPLALAHMCHDATTAASDSAMLRHTVGARADQVNQLSAALLATLAAALRERGSSDACVDSLVPLATRLASVTRLNAFRLASTSLVVQLTSDAVRVPLRDVDVDAEPIDSTRFVGLFSLACYLNHRYLECFVFVFCVCFVS